MSIKPNLYRTAEKAVLFYNSRNIYDYRGDGCVFPMCEEGKCICLDSLQAALLEPVLCSNNQAKEVQLLLRTAQEGNWFLYNGKDISEDYVCHSCYGLRFPHKLYDYGRSREKHYCMELEEIAGQNIPDDRGFCLLQNLSVFYLVNSTEELQRRDSELYLAVYGIGMEFLLSSLFVSIMDTVIERVVQRDSLDGIKDTVEELCGRLRDMSMGKIQNMNRIVDIMTDFSTEIKKADPTIESYVVDKIVDYRNLWGFMLEKEQGKVLSDSKLRTIEQWKKKAEEAWRRVLPIYALAKAVCTSAGLDIVWPVDMWLEELLQEETELIDDDVSFLIEKLQSTSGSERFNVLKIIGIALKSYSSWSQGFQSDEVEQLRKCV